MQRFTMCLPHPGERIFEDEKEKIEVNEPLHTCNINVCTDRQHIQYLY